MLLVIPSDVSYIGEDLRVFNQHTKEWSNLSLDDVVSQGSGALVSYQHLLDTVQADTDSVRGLAKLSFGWCTNQSRARRDEAMDMGLAAPNLSSNDRHLKTRERDTYGWFTIIARRLGMEWAQDKAAELLTPFRRFIKERFTNNARCCPPDVDNDVQAFTHLRHTLLLPKSPPTPGGVSKPDVLVTREMWGLDSKGNAKLDMPCKPKPVVPFGLGDYVDSDDSDYDEPPPLLGRCVDAYDSSDDEDDDRGPPPLAGHRIDPHNLKPSGERPLGAHLDTGNPENSEVVTISAPVLRNDSLLRTAFVLYERASLGDFYGQYMRYWPDIDKAKTYMESLPHPSLSSPTLDGYPEILGDQGICFLVDTKENELRECMCKTTASPYKSCTYISPVMARHIKAFRRHGFSLLNSLELVRTVGNSSTLFGLAYAGGVWLDEGLPQGSLLPHYEDLMKRTFGGHSMGPCQRTQPLQTQAFEKFGWAAQIRALGGVMEAAEARAIPVRESARPVSTTQLQRMVETTSQDLVSSVQGVGDLGAQHIHHSSLMVSHISHPIQEAYSSFVSASAGYRGRNLSTVQMRQVLLAITNYLGITPARAEALLCESSRKRSVFDLFPANSFLIGNPIRREGFGPNCFQMQRKRLDSDTWEPLEPLVPTADDVALEVAISRHITETDAMPDTVPVSYPKEIKDEASKRFYVAHYPGQKGNPLYDSCVAQIAKFDDTESHSQTMARLQKHIEALLGCCLSDRRAVLRRCKAETRHAKKSPAPGAAKAKAKAATGAATSEAVAAAAVPRPPVVEPVVPVLETAKPKGVTQATIQKATCGKAVLELTAWASNALVATGKLKADGPRMSKSLVEFKTAQDSGSRGAMATGFFATCPTLQLDHSNWLQASSVVARLSLDVFGGYRVRDSTTKQEKIVFRTKGDAFRCFLFLVFLMEAPNSPTFAADFVNKLFERKGGQGATDVWARGRLVSLELLAQGMPDALGYLVVSDATCFFAFMSHRAPGSNITSTKGDLVLFRLVTHDGSPTKVVKKKKAPPKNPPTAPPAKKPKAVKTAESEDDWEDVPRAVLERQWEDVQCAVLKPQPPLKKRKPPHHATFNRRDFLSAQSNKPCQSFSCVSLEDDALWEAIAPTAEEIANLQANMLEFENVQRVALQEAVEKGQQNFGQQEFGIL